MTTSRRSTRIASGWFALLALAAMAGQAAAAQFTFTVPVEIRDIDPRYPVALVGCFVRGAQNEQIGYKEVRFDIRPNSRPYAANVTLGVDPSPGKSASDVKQYSCVVAFCTSLQDHNCARPGVPASPALQPEPGTTFKPQVDGPIR